MSIEHNPNYMVNITGKYGQVVAHLPENFMFGVQQQYDAPFAQGLAKNKTQAAVMNFIASGGTEFNSGLLSPAATVTQSMTAQIWQGSQSVDFNLPMIFVAETDAQKDVIEPIKMLLKHSLPSNKGGLGKFIPPGPKATPTGGVEDNIKLTIGNMLVIEPVIIVSVQKNFDSTLDRNGIPTRAQVDVMIRTFYTPALEDMDKWFQ